MQAPEPLSGRRKRELVLQALKRQTPQERAAFLDGACCEDAALRAELEALLASESAVQRGPDLASEPVSGFSEESSTEQAATVLDQTAPTEGPGTIIGRYRLLENVGEGGFGTVWLAEQREPVKRRVALKVIKLGMDTRQVVARFEAERQALALMDHPNIAKVFDAGATDSGRPYFVMELVHGVPITKYCDQNNLPTEKRLQLFIQVCQAIQHAHQKGIIHRDIKPSNILVTAQEGKPVPKVIDFGIAKATQQQLTDKTLYTQLEQFIGTPAYMSPEQAEMSGLDIDTRSDIYSLGVLLYELLVGRTPFDAGDLLKSGLEAMRRTIREQEPVRPSTRLGSLAEEERTTAARRQAAEAGKLIMLLRGDLDWIVMKCLEKDRTLRYDTANGLAMDVERFQNHEPVVARPPSTAYRVQKFVRRNKVMVGAVGLVAAALVLGILVSTWQAIRATKARRDETTARARADSEKERAEKGEQKARESELAARENLYDADMVLAGQALQHNNIGRALSFLNRQRPAKAGERDLRGWEWRYLWAECRSDELAKLGEHESIVQSVAVSPDGWWVASGGWDGLLKIWALAPAATGGQWVTNLSLGGSPISSVAFSPDGRWLAAGSWTNGFALFNAPGWDRAMTVTNTEEGLYRKSLAFSADSRLLAVGGEIWSLDTRKRLCALPYPAFGWGQPTVAWLPDSQTIAGFCRSNDVAQVGLFDVRSTSPNAMVSAIPLLDEKGTRLGPMTLAFSPDGKHLTVGCWDGTIRIYAANDWRQVKILTNHTAWVSSLAFSKDGQWLASAAADHSLRVWRTRDWQETAKLRGHEEEVWAVVFTPDDQRLVSGSKDHSVRVWPLAGRSKPVEEVTVSAEGTTFFGLSGLCPFRVGPSNVLTVWDGQTLQVRQRLSSYPVRNVIGWRPSPDGRTLLMITAEGGVWLTDLGAGAVSPPVCLQTNGSRFSDAAFSDQAKWVAVADGDALRVWDLKRQPSGPGFLLAAGNFWGLRFSRDERLLAAGTGPIRTARTVLVWDLASGKELARYQPHRDYARGLDFSPDGTVLATASADNTSKLIDLRTDKIATLPGQLMSLFSVCFSPDGRRLATGTGGARGITPEILIWDLETGREVLVLKAGGSESVGGVRFHPSGDSLLSFDDRTLHLWRAPSWAEIEAAEKTTESRTQ